jgi:hypothetical protein
LKSRRTAGLVTQRRTRCTLAADTLSVIGRTPRSL